MHKAPKPEMQAALLKLRTLPDTWRNHASGDGSALYRAGFEHCADALELVLADLTGAFDAVEEPFIKCLVCRLAPGILCPWFAMLTCFPSALS